MRIVTLNCNGIRSAARKGFFEWLALRNADIVCLQETKSQEHQRGEEFRPAGWHCHYVDAVKPGYSGVALSTASPVSAPSAVRANRPLPSTRPVTSISESGAAYAAMSDNGNRSTR